MNGLRAGESGEWAVLRAVEAEVFASFKKP